MSTAVDSTQYTVSARDESHHPDAPASDKKRSIQHPKVLSQVSIADREGYMRMWNKVSRLWADFEGIAYEEVRDAILAQWIKSEPVNKKFLEKAVDLLVEFQNRPMKSMKDCLEWSDYLEKAEIDSKTYHSWVQEQYKQLACKKREGFENITLERFSKCLLTADWKDANDDSAIVNAYLLNAELCLKPEIYLGPFENFHLAVRVNGRCLRPRKADLSTAESYGVTAINPNILLAMRYVPRASWNLESFLFIPIGNVFRMGPSRQTLDTTSFREGHWKDTGVVLVLRILEAGVPGGLYVVRDLELWKTAADKGEESIGLSSDGDWFTLAKVMTTTEMDHRDLLAYNGIPEKPAVKLGVLADSKLKIVQTGVKGEWSEVDPPVGLYPIDQNL